MANNQNLQLRQSYRKSKVIKLFQFYLSANMDNPNEGPQVTSNQNAQKENFNNLSNTISIANFSLQQLLHSTFQQIKEKQLIKHSPEFAHHQIMTLLSHFINQSTPQYGTSKPSRIIQQDPSQIIKIEKDNLSPKQLPSQHPQKSQTVKDLDFMSSGGSKKLNMTNRSNFLKRKLSQMSQLPSGANTQRVKLPNNSSFRQNKVSQQKTQKSVSVKNGPLQNFTSLMIPQVQDPQIVHLRQIAHFNQKQKQKDQSIINQRIKQEQQKLQVFNSQYGESGLFTFDFEGEAVGSEVNKDQKLNYYAMKVGIKNMGNKFRTIYKHLESGKEQKNQQNLIKSRPNQNKKSLIENAALINATSDIPMFHRQTNSFVSQMDPSKLKIIQYKRLYGKKFSRYDKTSMTLDLSMVVDKKMTEEDFFTSKRHLTDSLSINKSRSSSFTKDYTARKLALPKLKGKYKVLDRYDQL